MTKGYASCRLSGELVVGAPQRQAVHLHRRDTGTGRSRLAVEQDGCREWAGLGRRRVIACQRPGVSVAPFNLSRHSAGRRGHRSQADAARACPRDRRRAWRPDQRSAARATAARGTLPQGHSPGQERLAALFLKNAREKNLADRQRSPRARLASNGLLSLARVWRNAMLVRRSNASNLGRKATWHTLIAFMPFGRTRSRGGAFMSNWMENHNGR
jgi:hypothetical protein